MDRRGSTYGHSMRLLPPVLCLLAFGCSADPSPADAGADGVVLDARAEDRPDVPPVDATVGTDVVDAVAVADAADAADGDAADVAAVDAAVDVGIDTGASPDVVLEDAASADAGPTRWPLDPPPLTTEGHVLYQRTPCPEPCDGPADTVAQAVACDVTGGRLSFSLRGCIAGGGCLTLTGVFPSVSSDAGATLSIVGALANQGRNLRLTSGQPSAGRRSFRVQFNAPAVPGFVGVTGVPGRTVDPSLGDLWLLGCAVR